MGRMYSVPNIAEVLFWSVLVPQAISLDSQRLMMVLKEKKVDVPLDRFLLGTLGPGIFLTNAPLTLAPPSTP
jgi:hypothetical protein